MNHIEEKLDKLAVQLQQFHVSPLKLFLNVKEAAHYLGMSRSTLYKLTSGRRISFYKPNGKLIRFEKKDLDDWLGAKRTSSIDELIRTEFTKKEKTGGGKNGK